MKRSALVVLVCLLAAPLGAAAQDTREDVRRGYHEALGAALYYGAPLEEMYSRPDHGDCSDPGWLYTETATPGPEYRSLYTTVLRTETFGCARPPDR